MLNLAETLKNSARKRLKLKNLGLVNFVNFDGSFDFREESLANPETVMRIAGDVSYWNLVHSGVEIEYYQFKNKKGEIRTMESLMKALMPSISLVTEQEKDGKFKWIYVFGYVMCENHFIGRIKQEDEFSKHALRVFRGFWSSGAGILKDADT